MKDYQRERLYNFLDFFAVSQECRILYVTLCEEDREPQRAEAQHIEREHQELHCQQEDHAGDVSDPPPAIHVG